MVPSIGARREELVAVHLGWEALFLLLSVAFCCLAMVVCALPVCDTAPSTAIP